MGDRIRWGSLGWYLVAFALTGAAAGWWAYVAFGVHVDPSGGWWTDAHLGVAGDSVAVFTALLTAVALFAALRSIGMQREELALQRNEMVQSRAELARQAEALEAQLAASRELAEAMRSQADAMLASARDQRFADHRAAILRAMQIMVQAKAAVPGALHYSQLKGELQELDAMATEKLRQMQERQPTN